MMIEKPDIADEILLTVLRNHYQIAADRLTFLPVGNDATAWAYRVTAANGARWFLKMKRGLAESSVLIPRALVDAGIDAVVAPLAAPDGTLWAPFGADALILYPYVDGVSAMTVGLSARQWQHLGSVARRIHAVSLPETAARATARENFVPYWGAMLRRLHAAILAGTVEDDFQRDLAEFWRAHMDPIMDLLARCEALGAQLRQSNLPMCVCHADIHTANIILDAAQNMWIVDWDNALLAPKERDLMFVVSDDPRVSTEEEGWFFAGYGETSINPMALAYYRDEWVVQEIGDYGERIFFNADFGEQTRAEALQGFRGLFAAGNVVEAAARAEAKLF